MVQHSPRKLVELEHSACFARVSVENLQNDLRSQFVGVARNKARSISEHCCHSLRILVSPILMQSSRHRDDPGRDELSSSRLALGECRYLLLATLFVLHLFSCLNKSSNVDCPHFGCVVSLTLDDLVSFSIADCDSSV